MRALYLCALVGLFLFMTTGCSSSPKKSASEKSVPFTSGVESVSSDKVSGGCNISKEAWESWNWRRVNENANRCLKEKNWKVLESIGHHISTRFYYSPWGPYYLSLVHEQSGQLDQALWLADLAVSKSKEQVGLLHYQKSKLLFKLGANSEAYDGFENAVRLNDSLWDAHVYLGHQSFLDGDYSKAARHLGKVLEGGDLNRREHFQMLAKALGHQKKWDQALKALDAGIRVHRSDVELRMHKAKIQEEDLRDLQAALVTYEEVLGLHGRHRLGDSTVSAVQTKIQSLKKTLEEIEREPRTPASEDNKA